MENLEHHVAQQINQSESFFWHRLRWRAISPYLLKDKTFRLLDVGAGAGLSGRYLKRDFPQADYCFIEPLESLRQHLRDKYGPSKDYQTEKNWTDVQFVTLLDVLEHQKEDKDFLRGILDKMNSHSTLFITVPAFQMFWSSWDIKLGHFRRYNKKNIRPLVENLPVEIIEMSYLFPEMIPFALFRKMIRRFSKRGDQKKDMEFPNLPRPINHLFTFLGSIFLFFRKLMPMGTSLLVVLQKS